MKATLIQKQEIIIGTSAADVEKGCSFLENVLQRYLFPKTVISETRFVCEAILQELADLHSEEELEINPRARSSKLRVAEKLPYIEPFRKAY